MGSYQLYSPYSPQLPYTVPTPTPEPAPTPTPTPTPGADVNPADATSALDDALQEPVLEIDDSGAAQLLSTAFDDGVPDPFANDEAGWRVDTPDPDPFTGQSANQDVLSPYVGGSDVDPFTGGTPQNQNANAYTGGNSINPFTGQSATSTDTSQWLASNDATQQGDRVERLYMGTTSVDGVAYDQYGVWVNGNFSDFAYVKSGAAASSGPSVPSATTAPSQSLPPPTPPSPTRSPAPSPTPAPTPPGSTVSQPLPPLPAPPLPPRVSESAATTPPPAPTDSGQPAPPQSPVQAAGPPATPPPTQPSPAPPSPPPSPPGRSLADQYFPSSNSFSWQQYTWAVREMEDPTNPWYGRALAGVGAGLASVWAAAERFVGAPAYQFLSESLQGLNMAADDMLHGIGLSDLDIESLQLLMWERDAPAAVGDVLSDLGVRADADVSQFFRPATELDLGGLPPRATGLVGQERSAAFTYGNLPPNVLGTTDPFGNITIAQGLPPQVEALVLRHESVHAFLSPGPGALRQARANLLTWGYSNSAFLRYAEEALAEGYATRSIRAGLAFPLTNGYVTPWRLGIEFTGIAGVTGLGVYGSYELLK